MIVLRRRLHRSSKNYNSSPPTANEKKPSKYCIATKQDNLLYCSGGTNSETKWETSSILAKNN